MNMEQELESERRVEAPSDVSARVNASPLSARAGLSSPEPLPAAARSAEVLAGLTSQSGHLPC